MEKQTLSHNQSSARNCRVLLSSKLKVLLLSLATAIALVFWLSPMNSSVDAVAQRIKLVKFSCHDAATAKSSNLTLQALRSGQFSPDIRQIQWIHSNSAEGDIYLTKTDTQYVINKITDDSYEKVLYGNLSFTHNENTFKILDLVASPDLKFALIATNRKKIWRHSSTNLLWLLDVGSQLISPLFSSDNDDQNEDDSMQSLCYFAKWSPDSTKLAVVKYDQNIYVKDIISGEVTQVTTDGNPNIFNGKPDWVYEEEVFENDFALWWNPTSEHIAFLKFNDTNVKTFPIDYFVQDQKKFPVGHYSSYPKETSIKYPKAGFENPKLSVHVFDLFKRKTTDLFNNFDDQQFLDYLVTEVLWMGNSKIFLRTTNRVSNILKIVIADNDSLKYDIVRIEETDGKSWFELVHDTVYIPKNGTIRLEDGYIDILNIDNYNHLAYFEPIHSKTPKKILTSGDYEVVDGVQAVDFETNQVFFTSTKHSSIDRHLYTVDLQSGKISSLVDDSKNGYYTSSFSKDCRNILISYLGPDVPYQKIVSIDANSTNENLVNIFERSEKFLSKNDKLRAVMKNFNLPSITYSEVELDDGSFANMREFKPFGFDETKKYPLFVYVYQGPNSQLINSQFSISMLSVISLQLNAVVVTVDGRGTGFKGKEFRSVVYRNLSHIETYDQINTFKKYIEEHSFIDPERTLIYGHSYGGYMTLKVLENDVEKVFKYGISGAPVTDWKLYDSIYTERYMGLPQENPNYEKGKVGGSGSIANFEKTKRFLLIHGSGDDNVHVQNMYQLLDFFNLNNLENKYDLMIFPDSNHGISHHNGSYIMYNKILWWAKMAFSGMFDGFDQFDYHNGNLEAATSGFGQVDFSGDSKYLKMR